MSSRNNANTSRQAIGYVVAAGHGRRTRPPGRRRADCQAGPVHPLGRRPRLVDRHVQPPRGGTHQCSRVTGHQQRRRAPRGQRAGRRGSGSGKPPPSARQQRCRCSSSRAAPPAGWRPTGSSSSPGAGHGTRASRKRLQRSSSTAPPASHGRRWPTSSAPPGTAPAPAAAGRARAPTKCTKRANASTAQQRKTAPPHRTGIAGPVFVAIRAGRGPGGRILTSGLPGARGRFYHHQAPAGPQAARRLPKRARQLPYCEKSHGGVDGTGRSWPPWGGRSRRVLAFRAPPPHPRDHPPYGPASVVTSTRLRGFFGAGGRRIDQPAPRGHGRGQLRRMLRALRFPVHRGAPGMAPGRAGNSATGHRTRTGGQWTRQGAH